ncbi:MAG: aldehyde dehydrogenase family protein [Pseudobutyrivibrio sp.]|nr:aldehyde dehydrogenase family protein [Pseudobutyrivibrio sp.]
MTREDVSKIVAAQHEFFKTGATYDVNWRIEQLRKLYDAISRHESDICQALHEDLGRSYAEGYLCDVLPTLAEISENIKHLKSWARTEKHFSGLLAFPSVMTEVNFLPYGTTLIIAPFNFPYMLSLGVLNAAISGGNTAVIKVSSKSEACSKVIEQIIDETFPPEYVKVIGGGHDVADFCLEERFDKIFYTGSPKVAKHVMECAAKNLTPVALELGGETGNWAIVRKDANLKDAARKIAFFKVLNSGQICININQVAVAEEVAEEFVDELKKALIKNVGEKAQNNPEYPKLISKGAYDKCAAEAEEYRDRIVFGGAGDDEACKYAPTVIYPVDIDERIVRHELFCPLLPVVKFKDSEVDRLISIIEEREHGLALYVFTKDTHWAKRTMSRMQFGGGCINEVVMHIMVKGVPFNGTGHSGMGAYHGIWGFREFTHPQTVLKGSTRFNLPLREHPYEGKNSKKKLAILKIFAR